jgi:PAS domain S-box-containing protein
MAEAFRVTLDDLLLPAHGIHDGARIVESSPDLARMFGYDEAADVRGCDLLDFIDAAYQDRAVRQVLGGECGVYESVGIKKGGATFPVQVSAQPILYHGSQARLILVRDLSPVALVVDDEAVVCKMMAALLRRIGYRTLLADSAEDGLVKFKPEKLALAVTDILMPEMNGIQFGTRLRAADSTLPIVYMSGYTHEALVLDENSRFIHKPFGVAELKEMIRSLPERARERLGGRL